MISRCCCPQRITTSLKHLHFTAKLLWRFTSGPKRLRYVLLWLIYRKSFIQMSKFRHLLLKISYRSSKSNFTTRTRTKLHREGLTTLPWIWIRDLKLWPLWEQTPLTKTFPCKKFVKYLPNGDELAAFVYGVSDYGHWGILYVVPFLAVSHWKGKQFSNNFQPECDNQLEVFNEQEILDEVLQMNGVKESLQVVREEIR